MRAELPSADANLEILQIHYEQLSYVKKSSNKENISLTCCTNTNLICVSGRREPKRFDWYI